MQTADLNVESKWLRDIAAPFRQQEHIVATSGASFTGYISRNSTSAIAAQKSELLAIAGITARARGDSRFAQSVIGPDIRMLTPPTRGPQWVRFPCEIGSMSLTWRGVSLLTWFSYLSREIRPYVAEKTNPTELDAAKSCDPQYSDRAMF